MLGRALVLAFTVAVAGDQQTDRPEPYQTEEAEVRAEALRAQIAAELTGLPAHTWAGRYYWGDGLGANVRLELAPRSGFVFEWHGCLGLYGRNYGPVTDTGARVILEPELPNTAGSFAAIDEDFVPVSWGTRRYLIAAGRVNDFCNAVNDGSEPRDGVHGLFLLRDGDEKAAASGEPRTPDGPLECLLARPITARIVAVGTRRTWTGAGDLAWEGTSVVLNVGSNHGVWEGMQFHLVEAGNAYQTARVTRVRERSSEAVFVTFADETFQPRLGWRLSTRRD